MQKYNINYQETFTLIIHINSFQILFAIIAIEYHECYQINVNNAFTELINTEDIYITLPEGILILIKTILYILKSLYSLK